MTDLGFADVQVTTPPLPVEASNMPEERLEAGRANSAGKVEKPPPSKTASSRSLTSNSNGPENAKTEEDKGLTRITVDLKECVLNNPASGRLPNGTAGKEHEDGPISEGSPSPSSTPPQAPSSVSSIASSTSKPSQAGDKDEGGPLRGLEPNNNHLPPEQSCGLREDGRRALKEASPSKSVTDARSKTATPQEQNCFKSARRTLRSKSTNGSPAALHSSLMGSAQGGIYSSGTSQGPAYSSAAAAHYYALYASSQSVPLSCQRHDQAVPQFSYRSSSQAMNGETREERLSSTNLFVRPLLETDTKETLIGLVASAVVGGDKAVKSARVTHDRKQHSYGFIDFYQEENARKALDFLSKDVGIRQTRPGLEVKYARDSEKDDKNVYLSGVPTDFTDKEQLLQLFQPFGAIDSVHIMTNSSGDPTGVAFVRFNATEDAEKAIDAVKSGDVLIKGKSVDAKFADRHSAEDKRRRRRQNLPPTAAAAGIYQNGAAGGLSTASAINGYGSMTSAHHALASASPQPHINMMFPSYHLRYFPTASGPTPFLSSSAPTATALGGSPSHFVSLHPSAYSLSGNAATQYPAAAAAMLGANSSHASQSAAAISAAAALNAAAAAAGYHHPGLTGSGSHGPPGASQSHFVATHDPAALNAYQAYYTAAMNGAAAGGGYGGVTENGGAGGTGPGAAAYFQPTAAQ